MHTSLAIAASGLRHADARARATAHDTANLATGAPTPVSSTGAVGHAVEQIATLHYAGALGNVARTTDDMLGSLIDMLG
jgi:hypothetical protein